MFYIAAKVEWQSYFLSLYNNMDLVNFSYLDPSTFLNCD